MTERTLDESAFVTRSVTEDFARRLIAAGVRAAQDRGMRMSFAVVDQNGLLKAFCRMDGASFTSGAVAQDKAYTSASGRPSGRWHEALAADAVLGAGARTAIPRMATLPGGFPISVEATVVGGFGASGGHYDDDVAVALAALSEVGALHEW